jgi:hypothetical protein
VTISGWQTSETLARRFEFTTEAQSYGHALGKITNLGVISAAFFKERAPTITSHRERHDAQEQSRRSASPPARAPLGAVAAAGDATKAQEASEEYAATGMGRRTDHAITQVWLDLEDTPARMVDVRYEFRPQLVRLGVLRTASPDDVLQRREGARGFEPGFAPEPLSQR